jgi:hypothetical protein
VDEGDAVERDPPRRAVSPDARCLARVGRDAGVAGPGGEGDGRLAGARLERAHAGREVPA